MTFSIILAPVSREWEITDLREKRWASISLVTDKAGWSTLTVLSAKVVVLTEWDCHV